MPRTSAVPTTKGRATSAGKRDERSTSDHSSGGSKPLAGHTTTSGTDSSPSAASALVVCVASEVKPEMEGASCGSSSPAAVIASTSTAVTRERSGCNRAIRRRVEFLKSFDFSAGTPAPVMRPAIPERASVAMARVFWISALRCGSTFVGFGGC